MANQVIKRRGGSLVGTKLCPCKNDPSKMCPCKGVRADQRYIPIANVLATNTYPTAALLADPTLWLEARRSGYAYTDGARVGDWDDLSGRAHHLKEGTTGNKPKFVTNSNVPYIEFDDANRKLNRAHVGAEPITEYVKVNEGTVMFTIYHYDNTQPTTVFSWDAASFDRFVSHCSFSDNLIYVDWGNRLGGGRVSFAEPSGWHNGWHTVEYNRNGNAFTCIIDGVTVYSNASAYSVSLPGTTNTFGIGNVSGFGWRMASMLVWDKSLNATQQSVARAYLNSFRP